MLAEQDIHFFFVFLLALIKTIKSVEIGVSSFTEVVARRE